MGERMVDEGLAPLRARALHVAVRIRMLVVGVTAVALVVQEGPDLRLTALVVLAACNLAYAITRVPWDQLPRRRTGTRWLYAWSVLDVVLVTVGVAITGPASSELFLIYAVAIIVFAASYPPRGQVALLAFTCASYLIAVAFDGSDATLGSTVVRLGALALVAYVAGFLSRELLAQTEAHGKARAESESRAELLAVVASAVRTMSTLDHGEVLETVVDSAQRLGFDGSELCLFDGGHTWHVAYSRGTSPEAARTGPLDTGAAGLVHARRGTVVLDEHSGWPLGVRPALEAGYRFLVASPVWSGGELVGALVAGSLSRSSPYPHDVECLDLLAAHAGSSLENAALYAERRAFEAHLAHQAFHDALTGLPNRALFLDRLEQALARTRRDGEPVGVLFMDLDSFKSVNDTLGHDRGDELLAAVAQRLQGCLRPGDTLARYGGDEFTVLLEKLRSDADGIDVADRLLKALADPFTLGGHQVPVSASIGVSFAKAPFSPDANPLREADQAMYRAKERGRGCWEVFRSEMSAEALSRLELESSLRAALDRGELYLAYQPQIELASGRISGVEALARWRHPTRGEIGPARFVPIAERTGMVVRLGAWALEEASRQVREWERGGLPELDVAVNVAPDQLSAPDFAARVSEVLARTGLPACRLTLEAKEDSIVGGGPSVADTVAELGQMGVRVAVDDFGRGRCALREMKSYSIHTVKMDRSLVAGLGDDAADHAIVRALAILAADLGMVVGGQGVETAAQLEHLRALGCTYAQGFWFLPALSAPALAKLLRGREAPTPAV